MVEGDLGEPVVNLGVVFLGAEVGSVDIRVPLEEGDDAVGDLTADEVGCAGHVARLPGDGPRLGQVDRRLVVAVDGGGAGLRKVDGCEEVPEAPDQLARGHAEAEVLRGGGAHGDVLALGVGLGQERG